MKRSHAGRRISLLAIAGIAAPHALASTVPQAQAPARPTRTIVIPIPGSAPGPRAEPAPAPQPATVVPEGPAPPSEPLASAAGSPVVDALVRRYAAGNPVFDQDLPDEAAFMSLRSQVFSSARAWREAWNRAGVTFLLDLSFWGFRNHWLDTLLLLHTAEEIVTGRKVAPDRGLDRFEVLFHRSALAALIEARQLSEAESYIGRLDARIARLKPEAGSTASRWSDPHLDLLRGLLVEAWTAPRLNVAGASTDPLLPDAGDRTTRDRIERAIAAFDRALGHPEVSPEARVRQAFLLHRLGHHDAAFALVREALAVAPDPTVRYWALMIEGRVLESLRRPAEAVGAYQEARAVAPLAQSPCVALASLFQRSGRFQDARTWAAAARAAGGATTLDPWWQYWPGDLRFLGTWLEEMRDGS